MMNLIFITLVGIEGINERGIYSDLMRAFRNHGMNVFIVSPTERRLKQQTHLNNKDGVNILRVRTLNIQKTNLLEKGIGTLLLERQFKRAIIKYFGSIRFDLIIYSTPPITITSIIKYLKKRNNSSISYLLLKDIFPQNAVDLGLITVSGIKGMVYKAFRRRERLLYELSDFIGCMSPANVEYLLSQNPYIPQDRVEVAPNSIELQPTSEIDIPRVRMKYNLPVDKPIFIYGGNLGKPQGIPFLIKCLNSGTSRDDCHFLIVGSGTEFSILNDWFSNTNPKSVTIMNGLPKDEYDELVRACDVGMIFLDHRFTIPNYPSRLLSYLENKMPVLCVTDTHSDIGRIAEANGYGYWCESNSVESFERVLEKMLHSDWKQMGVNGYEYLKQNYLVGNTYQKIISHV